MRSWVANSLLLTLFTVTAGPAVAAPIFGVSPRTQFFLGTVGRSFGQFARNSSSTARLDVFLVPLIGSYSFRTDTTLTAILPVVSKRLTASLAGVRRVRETDGIGDLIVQGKYRFFRKDSPFGRDQAALILAVKLPSGEDDESDRFGRLPPPVQPGTGSVDGIIGLAVGRTRRTVSLEGGVVFKANSQANNFRFGNVLSYDFAFQYQTYPDWPTPGFSQLNFTIEMNGVTSGRNELRGRKLTNSGGTVIFISPGLQYIVSANLLIEGGVQIPVIKRLYGSQLEPDVRARFGLRYIF